MTEPGRNPWAGRKITEGATTEIYRLPGCTGQVLRELLLVFHIIPE